MDDDLTVELRSKEISDSNRSSKGPVRYRKPGGEVSLGDRFCRECAYFRHPFLTGGFEPRGPGACTQVRGLIKPDFVCDKWKARQ